MNVKLWYPLRRGCLYSAAVNCQRQLSLVKRTCTAVNCESVCLICVFQVFSLISFSYHYDNYVISAILTK